MKASEIAKIIGSSSYTISNPNEEIEVLLTDSRRYVEREGILFFAIATQHNSGVHYVADLMDKGVVNFIVPKGYDGEREGINVWEVENVVAALQDIAAAHRREYDIPVVGITGSNGKTIVKDWMVQLLSEEHSIAASPKSYNSQIGVPLSVWQIEDGNDMAIFEAGISKRNEMENLQKVILPTIGVITNIGHAHDENFVSPYQKAGEKLRLFTQSDTIIYCSDHKVISSMIADSPTYRAKECFTWGHDGKDKVQIIDTTYSRQTTTLRLRYEGEEFEVTIPFTDRAASENVMHCICLMLLMGYKREVIAKRCESLTPIEMRMEMIEGINNCTLINDSYSLDINSLDIALDVLQQEGKHKKKRLIISDFVQSGLPSSQLYDIVANLVRQRGIPAIIGIGETISLFKSNFTGLDATFYGSTEEFLQKYDMSLFSNETILLKGARRYQFEKIAKVLQQKSHETIMEVNLDAMISNLEYFRSLLRPSTRVMAMVKASSYGAGKTEVANALARSHVDYLTVAYADEGVELRDNGITLPIMVMNPEESAYDDIISHHLEPDIYSMRTLERFYERAKMHGERVDVHIEFDTGMHRLGFCGEDVPQLIARIGEMQETIQVRSIFSHLACSEDEKEDAFTKGQIGRLTEWAKRLTDGLQTMGMTPLVHILNSSGIVRFSEAQMDMVRLGIGLYGIAPQSDVQKQLTQVSRLITRISQIKDIKAGEPVGYNGRWVAERESKIAILPIGYADGMLRSLGEGRGHVAVKTNEGKYEEVPIIGSICMDMCFIDVTGIECSEGDEVVIFGQGRLLQDNAAAAGTIVYELLTAVSPRVKRVYLYSN